MRRLTVPFSILILAFAVEKGWLGTLSLSWLDATTCLMVFGLIFLLAWRFRRGRIAFAVATLALAVEGLRRRSFDGTLLSSPQLIETVVLVSTTLALLLALLPWLNEWRVATRAGLLRLSLLLALTAAIVWPLQSLSSPTPSVAGGAPATSGAILGNSSADTGSSSSTPGPSALRQLLRGGDPFDLPLPSLPLPPLVSLAFLVAGISLAICFLRFPQPFEAGLLAVAAALFLAVSSTWQTLGSEGSTSTPLLFLLTAGVILGTSLLEGAFSLAFEDGLTRLPARRALEESLLQLSPNYTLAMVDIDHFKKLNDRHGHEVGDQVLRMVAELLRSVEGGGEAFRYGGEEFTVLFDGKSTAQAEPHLEALRQRIAGRKFEVRSPTRPKGKDGKASSGRGKGGQGKTVRVTVSLGAAQRGPRLKTPEMVMKAADKALYRSKKGGRNRLTLAK